MGDVDPGHERVESGQGPGHVDDPEIPAAVPGDEEDDLGRGPGTAIERDGSEAAEVDDFVRAEEKTRADQDQGDEKTAGFHVRAPLSLILALIVASVIPVRPRARNPSTQQGDREKHVDDDGEARRGRLVHAEQGQPEDAEQLVQAEVAGGAGYDGAEADDKEDGASHPEREAQPVGRHDEPEGEGLKEEDQEGHREGGRRQTGEADRPKPVFELPEIDDDPAVGLHRRSLPGRSGRGSRAFRTRR